MLDPDFLRKQAGRLRRIAQAIDDPKAAAAVETVASDLEAEAAKIERRRPPDPRRS